MPPYSALLGGAVMLAAWRLWSVRSMPELLVSDGEQRHHLNGRWTYELPGPFGVSARSGIKVAGALAAQSPSALLCYLVETI